MQFIQNSAFKVNLICYKISVLFDQNGVFIDKKQGNRFYLPTFT